MGGMPARRLGMFFSAFTRRIRRADTGVAYIQTHPRGRVCQIFRN